MYSVVIGPALLNVVNYHDLSVCTCQYSGFQTKTFVWRVGWCGELHPKLILDFF